MKDGETRFTSSTLCPLPWLHLSVNTDTSIRVCCNTDHGGHVRDESGRMIYLSEINAVDDYFNNAAMTSLRKAMMAGEKPEFCKRCYRAEENGGVSVRQIYLQTLAKPFMERLDRTTPDGVAPVEISYVDFSLGNECNLRCRMCNPQASYQLKGEFERLGLEYDATSSMRAHTGWSGEKRLLGLWEKAIPSIQEVLTTGGEPFISKTHLALLQKAVESGDSSHMTLRYHTNLTLVPPALVALWKHFKSIEVHTSIEAHGDLNHYIRYPSQWDAITKNLETLIDLKSELNLWLEVHTCFQAYNLLRLPELLEFLKVYEKRIPCFPHFIFLDNPRHLSAFALPPTLRDEAFEKVSEYLDRNAEFYRSAAFPDFISEKIKILLSAFNELRSAPFEPSLWNQFKKYTAQLDEVRKQSILALIPELKTMW